MNILVIPDVHCRKFWRTSIENNANDVEKIIFLGDYFDPYNETNLEKDEISMLNDIINLKKNNPDKYILLIGNHDQHYIWDESITGSRFNNLKFKKYYNIFNDNLDLFNLVYVENDVIFSHAGITNIWAYDFLKYYVKRDNLDECDSFVKECADILQHTNLKEYIHSLSDISFYRGGISQSGSCTWADVREHISYRDGDKIIPLGEDGIYQVFGHTQLEKELILDKWACLDCRKSFIIDTLTHEINEH